MNKLIKLSDIHYIIVDDSKIKEDDWVFNYFNNTIYNIVKSNSDRQILAMSCNIILEDIKAFPNQYKKIIHSTQPLEIIAIRFRKPNPDREVKGFDKIKPLSLSEIEEAIYEYSVEKMTYDWLYNEETEDKARNGYPLKPMEYGYINGFKAHQELVKDKLLKTIKELDIKTKSFIPAFEATIYYKQIEILNSLLPKTEWNIKITPEGKIELL